MRFHAVATALAILVAAPSAPAQPAGGEIEIVMSNFKFEPAAIHLRQNAAYALILRNASRSGHSFEAAQFFAAADMPAADRALVKSGRIEVAAGEQVRVMVVPTRTGAYEFHCTHPLHSTFGMTGQITVE
jgi:uncharacterized cupredoxin-like copper-binding protein